ncbi:MAG: glycerophosphodiester phosphodiesterase family protein [Treponemataceae bacterium]
MKVNIWAHRGCCYNYPENTLKAFEQACKLDITGIELDIQLTKDNKVVVIHDEKVDRTTNGKGYVKDFTLKQLKKLKTAGRQKIPTIEEVFVLVKPYCKKNGLLINIELKTNKIRYEGIEDIILNLVKEYDLEPFIIYSSFNPDSIIYIKEKNPQAKTAILIPSEKECLEFSKKYKVDALHPYIKKLDVHNIRQKTDLPIRTYGALESFYPEKQSFEILDLEELSLKGITDIFTNISEYYVCKNFRAKISPDFIIGSKIDSKTGFFNKCGNEVMCDYEFYPVRKGDKIFFDAYGYEYKFAHYTGEIDPKYIHEYCYQEEQSWTKYDKNLIDRKAQDKCISWKNTSYTIKEDGFIRLEVRHISGNPLSMSDKVYIKNRIYIDCLKESYKRKSYFDEEIEKVSEKVNKLKSPDKIIFGLMSDSHYTINDGWKDTIHNVQCVNNRVGFDGFIHLGDFTDGITPLYVTQKYTGRIISELKAIGVPFYCVIGNHDSNYFKGNPEKMSELQQSQWYLNKDLPYYYEDFLDYKLRVVFLASYDPTGLTQETRYGFSDKEVEWVNKILSETPNDFKVLFCSHVPILPKMHFWSKDIRNSLKLIKIIEKFNIERQKKGIIGFIHGHNHCDQINTDLSFPIVSIGCNKCEDFQDKKPLDSTTYERKMGTLTQDLWDVMLIDTKNCTLEFVRFGAGIDRSIGIKN